MKLQGLAIIFVLIILPISLIIGEYANTQMQVFKLEQLYDSRLITATEDALKAFQLNTFNDATSDIVDSKISNIEASANAFYNSMESAFGIQGYSREELLKYVPALVYTMYDGYYIYSPYTNIADISSGNGLNINLDSSEIQYGFKPYVYYSCRYNNNAGIDIIINYSLDNYITVQGIINGESVYKSGYLLTLTNYQNGEGLYRKNLVNGVIEYYYNGQKIKPEGSLSENLIEQNTTTGEITTKEYKYVKLNGTKYYWDEDKEYIFHLLGGDRVRQVSKSSDKDTYLKYLNEIKTNSNAIHYYESAYEFTTWVNEKLGNLKIEDVETDVAYSGEGTDRIFKNSSIEEPGSNFNLHRKEVIRYAIESNLSVAIANFNKYTSSGTNFQMPKLKETEWEMLENEISIISFLQGLNVGGKIYNGYTVVTNSKTEEVVKEERIYISTTDGYYHKINDKHFKDDYEAANIVKGFLDLDYEIRKDGLTGASYIHRNELGCYTSIVNQENVNNKYDSIYEYLQEADIDDKVKLTYYSALGRERWGQHKVENPSNINGILDNMVTTSNYTGKIVTDGLIRHLEATNIDGYGNNGNLSTEIWTDLSGHRNGIINGSPSATSAYVELDGNNDWIDLGKIEEPEMTLEAVVQFSDSGNRYILSNHETGGIGLLVRNDRIITAAYINSNWVTITSEKTIQYNKKYDISVTYDGEFLRLYIYVDGTLERQEVLAEGSIGKPQYNTVMAVGVNAVGENPEEAYANMKVYSIKVYNRGLTEGEIQKNYGFGKIVNVEVSTVPEQGWSNNKVVATIIATTFDISGMEKVYFKNSYQPDTWRTVDEISRNEDGNTITAQLDFEGQYKNDTVYFKAIDKAGNESDIVTILINNDSIKPKINNITSINGQITVKAQEQYGNLSRKEHVSGIKSIEYSYDNINWETENWYEDVPTISGDIATITGNWDPETYNDKTIYIKAIDNAGNESEVVTTKILLMEKLDLNLKLDGAMQHNGYTGVKVGLKVGGVDKGYISDYYTDHAYGTEWEIYGLKINDKDIPYTATGVAGINNWGITVELNTMTFKVNNTEYGTVTQSNLIVLKNTTYEAKENILKLSDGRNVTANIINVDNTETTLTNWEPASGTVTSAITITANFTRRNLLSTIDIDVYVDNTVYYDGHNNIKVGLKIDGADKGYVKDYCVEHLIGTKWEIYGVQINGENIVYESSGIIGGTTTYIKPEFYTMTFEVNNLTYGRVTRNSLIVLKGTTYVASSNVLIISDGRKVTANPINNTTDLQRYFYSWYKSSGIVTSETTIIANFR